MTRGGNEGERCQGPRYGDWWWRVWQLLISVLKVVISDLQILLHDQNNETGSDQ